MSLQDAQIHELELMARHEEAIGMLYEAYANRFPEYADFWLTLKGEEVGHAMVIRRLFPRVDEGFIRFNDTRFNTKAIETSLKFVRSWTVDAEEGKVEMLNALSIALDLENGLIEKKFLDVFEADDEDLKRVFRSLKEGTKDHKQRITDLLNEFRKKVRVEPDQEPEVPIG